MIQKGRASFLMAGLGLLKKHFADRFVKKGVL